MDEVERKRVAIYGHVQGVFFRASTQKQAQKLGVHGWVKNRRDGSVEAVFEGPAQAVKALIAWANEGPERARVDDIEISEAEGEGPFSGFEIRR